jgi:hypothetical protein
MLEVAHENDIELEGKDSDTYLVQCLHHYLSLILFSYD